MSDRQQETELRARFEAQRRAEAKQAPSFAALLARAHAGAGAAGAAQARRRIRQRRFMLAGGVAAAAVIATLLVLPRSRSSEDAFERAVRAYQSGPGPGAWQSPTDGLLNVPGNRLITTVPSIGQGTE